MKIVLTLSSSNAWHAYGNNTCHTGETRQQCSEILVHNMHSSIVWDYLLASWLQKWEAQQDIFNAVGSMYAAVLFFGTQNAGSVQPVVAIERTVFYREKAAGMYSVLPYAFGQRIPVWWRWCYYICPVAWTLHGLVASQFGGIQGTLDTGETVEEFARNYFDFKHDFVGYVAIIIAGMAILFGFIFAYSIRVFNFQKR
ncbi:unnamed protein product [Camellia sinensis]